MNTLKKSIAALLVLLLFLGLIIPEPINAAAHDVPQKTVSEQQTAAEPLVSPYLQQLSQQSTDEIKVFFNEKQLEFDVPPMIMNGRTMVPMRKIFEEMGSAVDWDGANQMVHAKLSGGRQLYLTIGSTSATLGTEQNVSVIDIDQPAVIQDGRTLVPLRFVSESAGAVVNWDAATRSVEITYAGQADTGISDRESRAGYVDPSQYAQYGWSPTDRGEIVDGQYFNGQGYPISEKDYIDMLAKRTQIYNEVITAGMSEYDKVQALHDWICKNVAYNYDVFNNDKWNEDWRPTKSPYMYEHQIGWAALMLGTAVCAGYADAYTFLLDGQGIESDYIAGPMVTRPWSHAWNLVRVDGSWYHVDATWNAGNIIGYDYFLVSDVSINERAGAGNHRDWDRTEWPAAPRDYPFPTVTLSVNDRAYGWARAGVATYETFHGTGPVTNRWVPGASVELYASPNSGFAFERWEVLSGSAAISDANAQSATFTMPNNDVTIRAVFRQNTPTGQNVAVIVNNTSWGTASANPSMAAQGATVNLTANANQGYAFERWEVTHGNAAINNINSPNASFTMTDHNVTVRAVFRQAGANIQPIIVNVNNPSWGTASANQSTANQGDTVILTANAAQGYAFDSWEVISGYITISNINSPNASFLMLEHNVSIRAIFIETRWIDRTITISSNNPSWGSASTVSTAVQGELVSLTATANPGYEFVSWETEGFVLSDNTRQLASFTMPNNDVIIRAIFRKIPTVTISVNNASYGDASSNPTGSLQAGTQVRISANINDGYRFVCWEVVTGDVTISNERSRFNVTFIMPDHDVEVRAVFAVAYEIIVVANDSSFGTANYASYSNYDVSFESRIININAVPQRGYRFSHWQVLSGGNIGIDVNTAFNTFEQPDSDIHIVAHFEPID